MYVYECVGYYFYGNEQSTIIQIKINGNML